MGRKKKSEESTEQELSRPVQGGEVRFPAVTAKPEGSGVHVRVPAEVNPCGEAQPTESDLGVVAAEVHRLQGEIGDYILRLSACDTMALSNTAESFAACAIDESHEAWSPAYASVRACVAREMALREQTETLAARVAELERRLAAQAEQHRWI